MVTKDRGRIVQPEELPATDLHYSLLMEWDPRDNIYVVTVPELPGCRTHGATYAEAIVMAQEAIESWVLGAREEGWELPAPRHFADDDASIGDSIGNNSAEESDNLATGV